MEDYDNKEKHIDIDDKMPTRHITSTKKNYFADTETKNDAESLFDAACDIADMYKEQYKSASKKDKALILAIVLPLALLLIIGAAGIFLANFGQALELRQLEIVGFVFMGVGLGGFFLYIVGILIWSKFR